MKPLRFRSLKTPLVGMFVALLAACGAEPTPPVKAPETPKPAPTEPAKPAVSRTAPAVPKRPVNVSDEIRALCKLPEPKEAPRFEFDTYDVVGDDRTALEAIAKCMLDGPLKGRSVRLIGRADPRGEQEYNMALGAKRSGAVKVYLVTLGVPEVRLKQTTRGELDAKGTDEESYRLDRRVDVELEP